MVTSIVYWRIPSNSVSLCGGKNDLPANALLDPDFFRCHLTEHRGSGGGFDRECLIVIFLEDADLAARGEAELVEEDQQLRVALVEADDSVFGAFRGVRKQDVATPGALRGALRQYGVAVGAEPLIAEALDQLGLEGRRDGMLEMLRPRLWIWYHSMPKISVSILSTR